MSRRFNLDPRAPARPPPAPPAPAAPGKAPASAPRPAAPGAPSASTSASGRPQLAPVGGAPPPSRPAAAGGPASPTPAANRRKLYLIAGGVVALLLVGGAIAIYAATELGYPGKYTLDDGEMPTGVSEARLTRSEMDDLGIRENPGEMDKEEFRDNAPSDPDNEPDTVVAQVLQDRSGNRILLLAMKYPTEDDARAAAADARALCSFAGGSALRDGDVLVLVFPEGASSSTVGSVARALLAKTDGLEPVCGPR